MQSNNSVLNGLVKNSSNFLLVSMILSFVLMFGIQMFYYAESFMGILPNNGFAYGVGICIGLFTQLCRLAFGLAGASEFASGRYGSGAMGLIFSFCITLFESFEVQAIALEWSGRDVRLHDSLLILFQFLIWTGLFLELRLAMNVSSSSTVDDPYKEVGFSANGTTSRKASSRSKS